MAAVKRVSDKPIKFIVNTHVHGDHTGSNENFARSGAILFPAISCVRVSRDRAGTLSRRPRQHCRW